MKWLNKARVSLRLKIAAVYDRRIEDACWASMVLWAVYPEHHPFRELWEEDFYRAEGRECLKEALNEMAEYGHGFCYCGKMEAKK